MGDNLSKILYVIPTPIGNLKDITLRALEVLKSVDLIIAEDTRISKKLLNYYKINAPIKSYHMYNEHTKLNFFIDKLLNGKKIGLISDAGTPSISDPGFLLIREAIKNKIKVECLPGATALIPAIVSSGLSTERFVFEGFLPSKKGRKSRIKSLLTEKRTIIFYESPHKIIKTLNELKKYFGDRRKISISREMTKIFEETFRGSLEDSILYFENKKLKGEFVICLSGTTREENGLD
jgi:16S rRNA (cytidine1402-2'-O)-methyltransferase